MFVPASSLCVQCFNYTCHSLNYLQTFLSEVPVAFSIAITRVAISRLMLNLSEAFYAPTIYGASMSTLSLDGADDAGLPSHLDSAHRGGLAGVISFVRDDPICSISDSMADDVHGHEDDE